ncbi:BrnA antitoxin family protein [Jannaschia sp. S6380]|uniref:BrnA antitoxin family protein n=1 Tax=Jannaschia sp. S6380 TaxID=2926408 RepID=UPI001FF1F412|nr:BrnA antitoxin family protein [Jannaschia sp. S6380]MCK0169274.1 BrnA antitoxin family protein [Jannaschia sp. S6380]
MAGKGARQREQQNEMIAAMRRFEWDMHDTVAREGRLPDEWREIWEGRGASKTRVTLRLDDDVLRFFKKMGAGHGPRMNAVLRSFMLARLAGLIRHGDLAEKYHQEWMGKPRPTRAEELLKIARMQRQVQRVEELMAKATSEDGTQMLLTPEDVAEMRILAEVFND